ncbi:MAG TPA: GNAT family N-acetyltransferase [Acidimicrobiales bacterium]|nr:GNAT family N-acetyltransferase [Acidimicrobiales bacterium]
MSGGIDVEIRRALVSDADALLRVHERAIRISAAEVYDPEQIEAWASPLDVESSRLLIERTTTFVAVADGRVVGFASLVPSSAVLDQLYVDPDAGGRGVARSLCGAVEGEAVSLGLHRLTTTASLRAAPALSRLGYEELQPGERLFNGRRFPVVEMARTLG